MSGETLLPEGYEALEPFARDWALDSADARTRRRSEAGLEGCTAFFEAAKDLVAPALAELDAKPLGELDEKEARLMKLLLGFAHASLAVEMQRDDEPRHRLSRDHLTITRAPADL